MTALTSNQSNKKRYKLISWQKINFILISLVFLAGALNLAISNNLAIKGFEIRDLKLSANLLGEKNRQLEANLMIMKSYENLKDKVNDLQLVAVDDVKHLSSKEATMAKR